ncbi:hypothetical protein BKA65DRAFT_508201 [Rhexocercosporidium sp. MPI-PUGE-AT-0058]|nr:hypothetical protein BKA65DRAFT_508201 [Rhexocercosporidium sp. MPI-PUGE-AT-0058]
MKRIQIAWIIMATAKRNREEAQESCSIATCLLCFGSPLSPLLISATAVSPDPVAGTVFLLACVPVPLRPCFFLDINERR